MELHLLGLALLHQLILSDLQTGFSIGSPSVVEAKRLEPVSCPPDETSHSRYHQLEDKVKLDLLKRLHADRAASLRRGGLFNLQRTTTLQRFNSTGSVDDDLEPRIDRYSSVEWLAKKSGFNPNVTTVFAIHGLFGYSLSQQNWANGIRNLIYRTNNAANMFYVDWNHKATIIIPFYEGALLGTQDVADDLYHIISNLKLAFPRWDSSNIHLAGHSLGAQVSGRLGHLLGGRVKQISGLDPADTLQYDWPPEMKLTSSKADFVIAYVTDMYGLGSRYGQADVNLLINGGVRQPGCTSYLCSHMRGAYYSSVDMGKCVMVGYLANSYRQYQRGEVGYCEEDSDACVGAGNWWQYDEGLQMSEKHFRPGPNWRSKRQAHNSSANQWRPYKREYYFNVAEQIPFCIFTYQVALGFENIEEAEAAKLRSFKELHISLKTDSNSTAGVKARLFEYIPSRRPKQSRPFGPGLFESAAENVGHGQPRGGKARDWRSGKQTVVYAGLAQIYPKDPIYKLMPLRFSQAVVWTASWSPSSGGGGGSWIGKRDQPQVYVNFMSDNRFERRQSYSGHVDHVYWVPPAR